MHLPKLQIKRINLRITLYFSSLLVLIAFVITFINIRIYSDELSVEIDNVVSQKQSLILGKLSENISKKREIHAALLSDVSVKSAFNAVYLSPSSDHIATLSSLLDSHYSVGPYITSIIALGLNNEIYNPISRFPAYQALTNHNPDFEKLKSNLQYIRFSTPNTFPLEFASPTPAQKSNITLYAQYFDYENVKLLGYLAINFRMTDLFSDVASLIQETFSGFYVIDDRDQLIFQLGDIDYSQCSTLDLTHLDETNSLINLDHKSYSVIKSSLSGYERWTIISLHDRSIIKQKTDQLNRYIYLTLIGALFIMIIFSFILSNSITTPIKAIIRSMGEFGKGQWPEPLTTTNTDEIKDLIEGYNDMLKSFIKLTDDMISRQTEKQVIELDLMQTQIGLLEAQINPHFIHNTLNSMNYLALKEGNTELSLILESFNQLLRMSMAIDISFITVSQEIQNIKDYVRIQKVRFEDIFEITYDIDASAGIGKIPKLILQPIVENSILHGILPKGTGTILIRIKKEEDQLRISILDDGVGIPTDTLKKLVRKTRFGKISKHIGVQNVYDRLDMYYAETMQFQINSTINEGTVTTIFIPYED